MLIVMKCSRSVLLGSARLALCCHHATPHDSLRVHLLSGVLCRLGERQAMLESPWSYQYSVPFSTPQPTTLISWLPLVSLLY